ncbi:pyrroline-5-carboxylate reductase [Jonesia denitrificans]|uniref:Pyrroline-5-carboxylate reductase n=1 Tax=Jonesia denitrificans (strain ATCC 14870 / DSM 20603 / BCRC 15368 / CIP 55.134 / JCM 11481 / NBRC 15587 / NCTC 10816 / Prevot 55134) TaxID=471856 RepID=C7R302_JONDD|nr:pyrroline-5-carboxylate reductase [Jonesia denitrificans]ACV08624.1 pyrroline-5-carboxylate reductase [Jonesia denitrificans DSM 20603]ASE09989.1 pyrroline-5-carboxylate reductase [Jonesia denitrificans]QXB42375.1 pyrroline-5-carboxylate reductase [Jonesia denitrificans]
MSTTVGFIGIGNMASAIIRGLITSGLVNASDIVVSSRDHARREAFAAELGVRSLDSNVLVALESDILVLAVKPAQFETVCEEIGEEIEQSDPLVVSVAAGLTLRQLADMLPARTRIARAMPNVNSSLREGMTAVCVNEHATSTDEASVVAAFEAVGQVAVLDESLFSAFTAIAGSSPAFTFLFIDALSRGAVAAGMPKDVATAVAAQAVRGSASLLAGSDRHPWELIDSVCSPGGTTVAGLLELERHGFLSTVTQAVAATVARDAQLRDQG